MRSFACMDKESYRHLPKLITQIMALLQDLEPDMVLSPAYEGGHPDHDTAAFIVAAARQRIDRPFRHVEYRLYHASPGGDMVTDQFLPGATKPVEIYRLTANEQQLKRRMLTNFSTQQHILKEFKLDDEQFRDGTTALFRPTSS